MNKKRPLLLILLVVYIFTPSIFEWATNAHNGWYRPFVIWGLLVVIAYVLQRRDDTHDF